jgi:hypothetical protein
MKYEVFLNQFFLSPLNRNLSLEEFIYSNFRASGEAEGGAAQDAAFDEDDI